MYDVLGKDQRMKHQNVTVAFNMLIAELETALKDTRQAAASATQQGSYDEAEARLDEARQIERFIADIRARQREWTALASKSRSNKTAGRSRLPRGERTPEEAYRLPILRALVAMGGEGKMQTVLDRVYQEMKSRLKPVDLKPLPSDAKTPRWRNAAQWERQSMVDEGLLRSDSPRGIWAVTEKGRKYLADHHD
ncbi:MAG: winged helix-turn-helix domain-containing protein [candidate division KSB1 bacterium]|nr:winged helix-turn-helix domain-containing protein [candidate division KSB1 bacterium]